MSAKIQRQIKRAQKLVQESLQSHVDAIVAPETIEEATPKFHKQCIKEYTQVLAILEALREYILELEVDTL